MKNIKNKIKLIIEKIKSMDDISNRKLSINEMRKNEIEKLKTIISEGKSERCSREMNEAIRMVFNINPKVKTIFKDGINRMMKEVFPDNYYGNNEYSEGEVAGVYDLEKEGRSVLNKLNTNYKLKK